jgi:acyl carrier protein
MIELIDENVINDVCLNSKTINKSIDFFKTWSENDFDDLDIIELVMDIEKYLNIFISDDMVDDYFNLEKCPSCLPGLKMHLREKKLNDLSI